MGWFRRTKKPAVRKPKPTRDPAARFRTWHYYFKPVDFSQQQQIDMEHSQVTAPSPLEYAGYVHSCTFNLQLNNLKPE